MNNIDYAKLIKNLATISEEIIFSFDANLDDISLKLKNVCVLLRIAKIEVFKEIKSATKTNTFGNENAVCYEAENYDPELYYTTTDIKSTFVDAKYRFYQFKGDEPFTDEEKSCMKFLSFVIYLVAANTLLGRHMNFATIHDLRFKNVFNNTYLMRRMNQLINENRVSDFGILQYNVNEFSVVNKKIGEKKATEVLELFHDGINAILENNPEENGFDVALGGDNGFILFKKEFKENILNFLNYSEFTITTEKGTEEKIGITARCGYSMGNDNMNSPHMILNLACSALNMVRKTPGLKSLEYDETFKKKFEMQHKIENWYQDALKNEEFLVYYQPKVDLHNYKLKGAEALVRWIHNEVMIFPDQFIPVIENNHSIKHLDLYMLDHVCADIQYWISTGKNVPQISVNLSRATLSVHNLIGVITSIIDKHCIPRSLIQIELTESASDADNEELRPLVTGFNAEGISTAVDDFGTGFSSLSLIKELPWDVLKIDKSLLHGAHKDGSRDQLMFKSIISMAQTMGLECIVEGVETKDDVKILKESGCFMAQGYYFSKPKPKAEFETILESGI